MSIVFTPTGGGGFTMADTGCFTSTGIFLTGSEDSVVTGASEYGYDFPTAAGVDGAGSKKFGFRNQRLQFKAYFVQSSEGLVVADWDTRLFSLSKSVSAVTVHGLVMNRCFLDGGASFLSKPEAGGGNYFAIGTVVMNSKGL